MKLLTMLALLAGLLLPAGVAHAGLDVYLENLSIAAHGDLGGFEAQLGARFGLSRGEVQVVLSNVDHPEDAALVLWLGEQSHQPRRRVLEVYREEKGHGWGEMARRLGIKPGSAAFHALKAGDLDFRPDRDHGGSGSRGHGSHKHHGKSKHK